MLDWNSLVYSSPLNDISKLSFWKTERLRRMHIQIDFINENAIFFRIHVLLFSYFFFSRKSFPLGVNKISCIHGSFLLSVTLPEVWNFHARPEECVSFMFSFSLFRWFRKFWQVLCLHVVWHLGWKYLHLKMPPDLLARTQEHWCQVWLHYQLQLNFLFVYFFI